MVTVVLTFEFMRLYLNMVKNPLSNWPTRKIYFQRLLISNQEQKGTQVLRRFKSCSRRVGDSRWWGSLTVVQTGNKIKRLSSVNHTTKTNYHHNHHHHHHNAIRNFKHRILDKILFLSEKKLSINKSEFR